MEAYNYHADTLSSAAGDISLTPATTVHTTSNQTAEMKRTTVTSLHSLLSFIILHVWWKQCISLSLLMDISFVPELELTHTQRNWIQTQNDFVSPPCLNCFWHLIHLYCVYKSNFNYSSKECIKYLVNEML